MNCPMFGSWIKDTQHGEVKLFQSCLKEECAFWDNETNECSKLSEEKALRWISRSLQEIRLKMSHEAQFRK